MTVGPVVRLWRRARRQKELPSPQALRQAEDLVGYKFVRLDAEHQAVELLKKGMAIDLGGIAKGYAMDEALAVLQRHGITRALVEAGGDMRLGDPPPGRSGWRVGIPPLDDPQAEPVSYLEVSRVAVSTSGDMMQYVEIGGKRYSHIVDPRTGMALTDHCRVMVVGPDRHCRRRHHQGRRRARAGEGPEAHRCNAGHGRHGHAGAGRADRASRVEPLEGPAAGEVEGWRVRSHLTDADADRTLEIGIRVELLESGLL